MKAMTLPTLKAMMEKEKAGGGSVFAQLASAVLPDDECAMPLDELRKLEDQIAEKLKADGVTSKEVIMDKIEMFYYNARFGVFPRWCSRAQRKACALWYSPHEPMSPGGTLYK